MWCIYLYIYLDSCWLKGDVPSNRNNRGIVPDQQQGRWPSGKVAKPRGLIIRLQHLDVCEVVKDTSTIVCLCAKNRSCYSHLVFRGHQGQDLRHKCQAKRSKPLKNNGDKQEMVQQICRGSFFHSGCLI